MSWLASNVLSNAADIFNSVLSPFSAYTGTMSAIIWGIMYPNLAQAAAQLDHDVNALRGDLVKSLQELIDLGETIQGWIARYPSIPTDDAGLAEFERHQKLASEACERVQRSVAAANNRFVPLTSAAREFDQAIDREVRRVRDDMYARRRATESEISNLSPPWYVYLGGPAAIVTWMLVEENRLKSELSSALGTLQSKLDWLDRQRSSTASFQGHLLSWKDMTANVSSRLGGTYNILSAMWGQLLEDPTLYAELLATEWRDIVRNARETIELLQKAGSIGVMVNAVAMKQMVALTGTVLVAEPRSQKQFASPASRSLSATQPPTTLVSLLQRQMRLIKNLSSDIDALLRVPFANDLICYWDASRTQKYTFVAVAARVRVEHNLMLAKEYAAIEGLNGLAVVQEARAADVATGRLPIALYGQHTLRAIGNLLLLVHNVQLHFARFAQDMNAVFTLVDSNLKYIEDHVAKMSASTDLAALIGLIADTIAASAASDGLFLAVNPQPPNPKSLSGRIDVAATATATDIKKLLESLPRGEVAKFIPTMQAIAATQKKNCDQLTAARPVWNAAFDTIAQLENVLTDMDFALRDALGSMPPFEKDHPTGEEEKLIKSAWGPLRTTGESWMELLEKENIEPMILIAAM